MVETAPAVFTGKQTVLVVEDESSIVGLIETFLTREGYLVQTAANGKAGLDLLQAGSKPGIILLDIRMPVMNGYEFMNETKKHDDLKEIPIVVMSASDNRKSYSEYPQVNDILSKPFDIDNMLRIIRRNIRIAPSPSLAIACI